MDQLTSTPPVFTQAPVVPEPPKKSFKWLVVALIVFLLAVTSVFAYKYYQIKQQTTQTQPLPTPTPLVSPQPTVVAETADWKTYTIEEYGVSFRLPPELTDDSIINKNLQPDSQGYILCWSITKKFESRLFQVVFAGGTGCTTGEVDTPFIVGGPSKNWQSAGRMGMFADNFGYSIENGQYKVGQYLLSSDLTKEFVNNYGVKILKVIGKSGDPEEGTIFPVGGTPGQGKLGAIINLSNNPSYSSLTIEMKLSKKLTEPVFDLLLSTFKFIPNEPVKCTQNIDPCDQLSCDYDPAKCNLSCQESSNCPAGYFCNTFDNLCYLQKPD